jgi:hypothetical protein
MDMAKHQAPERLYAEPVAEFTDLIVNCLLKGRDVDEIKYPEDGPTLLTSCLEKLSGRVIAEHVQPCSPVLVASRPICTGAVILALSELTGCSWTAYT